MEFVQYVKICLIKFVDFNGRARRAEYWWFVLFLVLIGLIADIMDFLISFGNFEYFGPFNAVAFIIGILPGSSVTVRRLHDTGKSGWIYGIYLLGSIVFLGALVSSSIFVALGQGSISLVLTGIITIILVIYTIYLIYLMIIPGDVGPNQFGEDPLNNIPTQTLKSASSSNNIELLQRLHELHEKGILTDDEFNQRKAAILGFSDDAVSQIDPIPNRKQPEQKQMSNLDALVEIDKKVKEGRITPAEALVEKGKILGSIVTAPGKASQAGNSQANQRKTCTKCSNQIIQTMLVCPKCGNKEFVS